MCRRSDGGEDNAWTTLARREVARSEAQQRPSRSEAANFEIGVSGTYCNTLKIGDAS